MNVIALQFDIAWENKAANFEKVRRLLNNAEPEKDSLVVLPEMFATGFSMNTDRMAEAYGGETEQFLATTAGELGVCLIAGAAMRGRDGRVRNKALVFSPAGELIAFYAKMHPFITVIGAFAFVPLVGILGLLVGPLAISYFFELVAMYNGEYLHEDVVSPVPAAVLQTSTPTPQV